MKRLIVALLAYFLGATSAFAQDQIIVKRKDAFLNDKKLSKQELSDILRSDPESSVEYQKAKANGTIGAVPMLTGTVLCFFGSFKLLMTSLEDKKAVSNGSLETTDPAKYTTPIIAGAGLILISLPFVLSSNHHLKKSINLHNSSSSIGFIDKVQLDFGITQYGARIVCRF